MSWITEKVPRLINLTIVFMAFQIPVAHALEEWVQVASGGLGFPDHTRVDAMVLLGRHVYIATRSVDSDIPRVFRASTRDDHVWDDVTPPWTDPGVPVTDMTVVGNALFASRGERVGFAELWRYTLSDGWTDVTPTFPDDVSRLPIKALATVRQSGSDNDALCMARTRAGNRSVAPGMDVWCLVEAFRGPFWIRQVNIEEPIGSGSIGTAELHGIGGALYMGFGGFVRVDRPCQVWKLQSVGSGLPIGVIPLSRIDGRNCFETGQGFVGAIWGFRGRAYVGLAGGAGDLFRIRRSGFEDITPFPIRNITSFAVSAGRLYAGLLHDPTSGPVDLGAGVIVTDNGEDWEESNEPGFGISGNRSTGALAGSCAYLYAGTGNSSGFQVFRRTARLDDILPCILTDIRGANVELGQLRYCVISGECPILFDPFSERLESIRDSLEGPIHPEDDLQLVLEGQSMLKEAFAQFAEGKTKIIQSQQEASRKVARQLARQGLKHMRRSTQIARRTWLHLRNSLADEIKDNADANAGVGNRSPRGIRIDVL